MEFAGHRPLLVLALVVVFVLFLANELRRSMRGFREIGPAEATRMINDGAVVIDVRDPGNYKGGHIAGAVNYPADRVDAHLDEIKKRIGKAGDQPVLVYCDAGISSARVAAQLTKQELGVAVCNLKGGLGAWRQENMPLKKG